MTLSLPEKFKTPMVMLMKGIPEELLTDEQFQDTVLVYLKLGGVSLARQFVETKKRFMGYDPLEVDTGFRFPRLQEASSEEDTNQDDHDEDHDDDNDEDDEKETADEADDVLVKDDQSL